MTDEVQVTGPPKITYAPVELHGDVRVMLRKGFYDAFGRGEFSVVMQTSVRFDRGPDSILRALMEVLPNAQGYQLAVNGREERNFDALIRGEGWWILVDAFVNGAMFDIGAPLESAREIERLLQENFNTREVPRSRTRVRISTKEEWTERTFDDVTWDGVANHYAPGTRRALSRLVCLSAEEVRRAGGRIVILYGQPGTGKSWAVRALLSAWKGWAEAVIILDPERFLGDPHYFLQLCEAGSGRSTRVLVLEDADEVVERQGTRSMGLARMLNMADGIVGSLQDSILLVTTNALPAQLDQALLRPGRCLATIGFDVLDPFTANGLLGENAHVDQPVSLAEVYRRKGRSIFIEADSMLPLTGTYL